MVNPELRFISHVNKVVFTFFTDASERTEAHNIASESEKNEIEAAGDNNRKTQIFCDVCEIWHDGVHVCPEQPDGN